MRLLRPSINQAALVYSLNSTLDFLHFWAKPLHIRTHHNCTTCVWHLGQNHLIVTVWIQAFWLQKTSEYYTGTDPMLACLLAFCLLQWSLHLVLVGCIVEFNLDWWCSGHVFWILSTAALVSVWPCRLATHAEDHLKQNMCLTPRPKSSDCNCLNKSTGPCHVRQPKLGKRVQRCPHFYQREPRSKLYTLMRYAAS